jgi:hypothetical protein
VSRIGRGPGALRRWGAVATGVSLLVTLPYAVDRLPVDEVRTDPAGIIAKVRESGAVAHTGYAESAARVSLPDVRQVERVIQLLGGTTQLRVWWLSATAWRVDAVSAIGEYDIYRTGQDSTTWDSFERRATVQTGQSAVRLAQPSDLLPSELGRRLAAAARPEELSPLRARRVAGVAAVGVRITPRAEETTVERVDLWADPDTGLPLRVEVTERGAGAPVISTAYLEIAMQAPAAEDVTFRPADDVAVDLTTAPDIAAEVEQFSPFALPAEVGGRQRRTTVGSGAATYGEGFGIVAALVIPERLVRRVRRQLEGQFTEPLERPYGEATVVRAPLLNGLVVDPTVDRGYGFVVSGAVPVEVLERVAADLAGRELELR